MYPVFKQAIVAATYSSTIPKADDGLHRCTQTMFKACSHHRSSWKYSAIDETTSFEVDKTDPNAATSLSWVEGSTHDSHTLNASWSVSSSTDISSQILRVHSNSSCSSQEVETIHSLITQQILIQ